MNKRTFIQNNLIYILIIYRQLYLYYNRFAHIGGILFFCTLSVRPMNRNNIIVKTGEKLISHSV